MAMQMSGRRSSGFVVPGVTATFVNPARQPLLVRLWGHQPGASMSGLKHASLQAAMPACPQASLNMLPGLSFVLQSGSCADGSAAAQA